MKSNANYNDTEHNYLEDGADYLEETHCEPDKNCKDRACSLFCDRYDAWYWQNI